MLSLDIKVNEAGLNENKLLNHDLLPETLELVEVAELGPEREGMKGVGSMLDRFFFLLLSIPKASWPLLAL